MEDGQWDNEITHQREDSDHDKILSVYNIPNIIRYYYNS